MSSKIRDLFAGIGGGVFKTRKAKQIAYARVFGTDEGKKVLLDLMSEGHMLEPEQNTDVQGLTFRAGRRDIVMTILININATLNDIIEGEG